MRARNNVATPATGVQRCGAARLLCTTAQGMTTCWLETEGSVRCKLAFRCKSEKPERKLAERMGSETICCLYLVLTFCFPRRNALSRRPLETASILPFFFFNSVPSQPRRLPPLVPSSAPHGGHSATRFLSSSAAFSFF